MVNHGPLSPPRARNGCCRGYANTPTLAWLPRALGARRRGPGHAQLAGRGRGQAAGLREQLCGIRGDGFFQSRELGHATDRAPRFHRLPLAIIRYPRLLLTLCGERGFSGRSLVAPGASQKHRHCTLLQRLLGLLLRALCPAQDVPRFFDSNDLKHSGEGLWKVKMPVRWAWRRQAWWLSLKCASRARTRSPGV